MNDKIKETAIKLQNKFETEYIQWCNENPGYIMNGNIIKVDTMKKASHCETLDEIEAMETYYHISLRSAVGVYGFKFSLDAIHELLTELYKTQ
jgi:hypothetical protein